MAAVEATESFACFGSSCAAFVTGQGAAGGPQAAVELVKRSLLGWHRRFSRFEAGSELSRLNADPRGRIPVSAVMARFAQAVVIAAAATGGLVDATLVDELETAGYRGDLRTSVPLELALQLAPPRQPASARRPTRWSTVGVDLARHAVRRPPGLRFDSGGLVKGLFADILALPLATHDAFAVDCAGDLRVGGRRGGARAVHVESPFDDEILHTFELVNAGVATSGIGKRSWIDAGGHVAHHLLDPATGRPAFTGVVQATAVAATALEAEYRAKAAVLAGPASAAGWLPGGGVVVLDDGSHQVVEAATTNAARTTTTAEGTRAWQRL